MQSAAGTKSDSWKEHFYQFHKIHHRKNFFRHFFPKTFCCFIQFSFKNSQLSWAQILQLFFRVLSRALMGEMHCYPKKYRSLQLSLLFISPAISRTMIFCLQPFNCIYSCFAFSIKGKSLAIHLAHDCSAPERKKFLPNIFCCVCNQDAN